MGLVGFIVGILMAFLIYQSFPSVPSFICGLGLCGVLGLLVFGIVIAIILSRIINI